MPCEGGRSTPRGGEARQDRRPHSSGEQEGGAGEAVAAGEPPLAIAGVPGLPRRAASSSGPRAVHPGPPRSDAPGRDPQTRPSRWRVRTACPPRHRSGGVDRRRPRRRLEGAGPWKRRRPNPGGRAAGAGTERRYATVHGWRGGEMPAILAPAPPDPARDLLYGPFGSVAVALGTEKR